MMIGTGLFLFLGFDTLKKFLNELGFGQSQEGHEYDNEVSDPGSPWSPLFWKTGPAGTKLLTVAYCQQLAKEIDDCFSPWGDDEAAVTAIFKRFTTQSQLSFYVDWVNKNIGVDLLKWLKGSDVWPNDRLSVKEISVITEYIKSLPKYK